MKLNPKILWGLAWAGLALIVAVPSADLMTAGFGKADDRGSAAVLTSDVEAVTTPAAAPSATTKPATKGGSFAPTLTPVTATEVTATRTANGVIITPPGGALPVPDTAKLAATQDVAAIDPVTTTATTTPKIVPRPMDSWLRPTGPVPPAATATAPAPSIVAVPAPATTTAALPPPVAPAQEPVVIIEQPRQSSGPTPPSPIVDDTANWEEESLRDYLERRGILSGNDTRSSATVTQRPASPAYDPDGFYLSDGPGGRTPSAEERFWELFEEDPEGFPLF